MQCDEIIYSNTLHHPVIPCQLHLLEQIATQWICQSKRLSTTNLVIVPGQLFCWWMAWHSCPILKLDTTIQALCGMTIIEFWSNLHLMFSLKVELTRSHNWFRQHWMLSLKVEFTRSHDWFRQHWMLSLKVELTRSHNWFRQHWMLSLKVEFTRSHNWFRKHWMLSLKVEFTRSHDWFRQ